MATYNPLNVDFFSMPAGGTIAQGALCKLSSGTLVVTTAITDDVIGVAVTSAVSGDNVSVQMFGIAKVLAGATITAGQELMPIAAATGRADVAAGATAKSIGFALDAGAAGELIRVVLRLSAKGPANS